MLRKGEEIHRENVAFDWHSLFMCPIFGVPHPSKTSTFLPINFPNLFITVIKIPAAVLFPIFAVCHLQQSLLPECLQQKKWVNYLVELDHHGLYLLLIIRTAFRYFNDDVNGGISRVFLAASSSFLKLIILSHPMEHSNQLSIQIGCSNL